MSEILGILFAVFIGILIIPKVADYQKINNDNIRASITAQQQKQLNAAATTYIQQNSVAIQAIATPTVPAIITVAMLQDTAVNLLPAAFSATNPYGQTWQIEVLEPTAGNLQALAMSINGDTLPDTQTTKIATLVGATGGFLPQNDSGIYPGAAAYAYGSFAGWTIPTANYTSITGGHLASLLTFNSGQLVNNYLYRNAVPGQPQLNTMEVPLQLGAGTVQTSGGACIAADLGKLARDASGNVLMCNGTNWKTQGSSYWQDPSATFAALPACNAAAINQTRIVQTPTTGTGPRAYTCDGATWQPLAVDDTGNMTIAGNVTGTGGVTTGLTATIGAVCAGTGTMAKDLAGTGLLLSCQYGVWKTQGGADAGTICGWYAHNFNLVTHQWGSNVSYCKGYHPGGSCPPGYTQYASWAFGSSHYNSMWCSKN